MVANDHMVLVHLHKTAGSFVTELLLRMVPGSRRVGYHFPAEMIPAEHRHLPVLGTVRNPWDFYVSYFFFQDGLVKGAAERARGWSPADVETMIAEGHDPRNGIDVLFDWASADGARDFRQTTRAILSLGRDNAALDDLLERMPLELNRRGRGTPWEVGEGFRGMNIRVEDLERVRGTGRGLLSFLFHHLYDAAPGAHFLKSETLRAELLDWLRGVGVPVTPEMVEFVQRGERVNASKHDRATAYYDASLSNLVADSDGEFASRFGYVAPALDGSAS
jgi:hypothetical protein